MLKSLLIAFSMYSRLPMPRIEWEEKDMKYSLCFFPLVGVAIGLCSVGSFYGMRWGGFGKSAIAAVLTILPIFISGGIHMDGFLDTVDAKSSWKPQEEKLKILKDPHTGAFAIIYGIVYLLLCYGMFSEVAEKEILSIAAGYTCSRILSGLSIVTLRKAKSDGMAAVSADSADKKVKYILIMELVLWIFVLSIFEPLYAIAVILTGAIVFDYYRKMSYRFFGGITGDLAGYFLQLCELVQLIAITCLQKLI